MWNKIRIKFKLNEVEPFFPFYFLSNFTWFRKMLGGTWHLNRYIYDMGRVCLFNWERKKVNNNTDVFGHHLKTENYSCLN